MVRERGARVRHAALRRRARSEAARAPADRLSRAVRYRARVVGKTFLDRLLRRVAGGTVEISITTWGGTFFVIEGRFERVCSRFQIITEPREDGTTLCQGIVFARRRAGPVLRALRQSSSLWVRRLFTYGYLLDETRRLRGTLYRPRSLGEDDRDMVDFYGWVVSLPQGDSLRSQELEVGGLERTIMKSKADIFT
jgi:hypothetical protein